MKTTAQKAQYQKALLIVRLHAIDPTRSMWNLSDSYQTLLGAILYLSDRKAGG